LQQKVEDELDRLQHEGILKPVEQSEWAAPIDIVRKGDGIIRICSDYEVIINPYLEMKAYPMPNPQDLFASSAGGRYFSRLDMKQAYQQMKVSENSRQYPIINTSNGSFVYTRMPLGVSSAPSIWQRAMDGILAGIPGVECYLDDALLIGKTEQEHDGRLQAVLERPSDLGLRLKKEKCEFRQSSTAKV
jgi:hypothetical protein